MSETYIPRAIKAGARVIHSVKVEKIIYKRKSMRTKQAIAVLVRDTQSNQTFKIKFAHLFVCCGAVQTPLLMRKSGIKKNIGNSLHMHNMAKIVAKFSDKVNTKDMEIPVHQVKEFDPKFSLGCSISSLPFLALGLQEQKPKSSSLMRDWQQMAIYYATNSCEKKGKVRVLPFFKEAFVSYPLTKKDLSDLADGLISLGEILLKAGAEALYMPAEKIPEIKSKDQLHIIKEYFITGKAWLSTVHLFSSCPMGENTKTCAVDSYGKLFHFNNVYINDSSILPNGPGVNPQGIIMAVAYRNITEFIRQLVKPKSK